MRARPYGVPFAMYVWGSNNSKAYRGQQPTRNVVSNNTKRVIRTATESTPAVRYLVKESLSMGITESEKNEK